MKAWLLPLIMLCAAGWLLVALISFRPELIGPNRSSEIGNAFQRPARKTQELSPRFSRTTFQSRINGLNGLSTSPTAVYRSRSPRDGIDLDHAVATHLGTAWNFANLNIGLHTASKASPAVDESGVYVGGDSGWFYAFDHDGTVRWKFHVAESRRGIHSTAVLTADRVCFGSYAGTFYCLLKTNGEILWTLSLASAAFGGSPLISEDTILTSVERTDPQDGFVIQVKTKDGELVAASESLGDQIHSSPTFDESRKVSYFGSNNGLLWSTALQNQQLLWKISLGGPIKSTPLLVDRKLYVTSWGHSLSRIDPVSGAIEWQVELGARTQSSPTLFPGTDVLIVGAEKFIYGIDRRSGLILWKRSVDEMILSSALMVKNPNTKEWIAWISCGSKAVCAYDSRGAEHAKIELPGRLTGVPVAFDSGLYLALDFPGGLVRLEPRGQAPKAQSSGH